MKNELIFNIISISSFQIAIQGKIESLIMKIYLKLLDNKNIFDDISQEELPIQLKREEIFHQFVTEIPKENFDSITSLVLNSAYLHSSCPEDLLLYF